MKKTQKVVKEKLPTLIYIICILLVYLVVVIFFKPIPEPSTAIESLSNLQEKALDILVEMNKLIMSFSLLIVGGLGGFLISKYKEAKLKSFFQIIIVILGMISASLSIYFGYVLYLLLAEMLSNNMFDPYNNMIYQPQQYQYYTFIVSLLLFGLLAVDIAADEISSKNEST